VSSLLQPNDLVAKTRVVRCIDCKIKKN